MVLTSDISQILGKLRYTLPSTIISHLHYPPMIFPSLKKDYGLQSIPVKTLISSLLQKISSNYFNNKFYVPATFLFSPTLIVLPLNANNSSSLQFFPSSILILLLTIGHMVTLLYTIPSANSMLTPSYTKFFYVLVHPSKLILVQAFHHLNLILHTLLSSHLISTLLVPANY